MVRVLTTALIVLSLPCCAIAPPSSMFSSLNSTDDGNKAPPPAAAPAKKQASAGPSASGFWESVKSGFGAGDGDKPQAEPAQPEPPFDPVTAQKIVNAYRSQKGLKPLKLNAKLNEAARRHSEDLAKSDRISHFGSDGSDAWERVRKVGYGARVTAENVGTGQNSVDEVVRGWQKSRDHNANLLLGDAEEMGIAMVYKPETQFKTFWTMVLSSPRTASN